MQTIIEKPNKYVLLRAKEIINSGGAVAFHTETVYGLGADALNENAVNNIFNIKGRPNDNPLIVHMYKKSQMKELVKSIPKCAKLLMNKFMPGALTIILQKSHLVPNSVTAGLDTVALRIPSSNTARLFLKAVNKPIAAPSANTSKRPSPTLAQHVFDDLNGKLELIIDGGACQVGIESTVINMTTQPPTILRPGLITKDEIEKVIGKVNTCYEIGEGKVSASPGVKYKHYAPTSEMIMVKNDKVNNINKLYAEYISNDKKPVVLCFAKTKEQLTLENICLLGDNSLSAVKNFYKLLRQLEKDYDAIIAEAPDEDGVAGSLYNRMIKSCDGKIV